MRSADTSVRNAFATTNSYFVSNAGDTSHSTHYALRRGVALRNMFEKSEEVAVDDVVLGVGEVDIAGDEEGKPKAMVVNPWDVVGEIDYDKVSLEGASTEYRHSAARCSYSLCLRCHSCVISIANIMFWSHFATLVTACGQVRFAAARRGAA